MDFCEELYTFVNLLHFLCEREFLITVLISSLLESQGLETSSLKLLSMLLAGSCVILLGVLVSLDFLSVSPCPWVSQQ